MDEEQFKILNENTSDIKTENVDNNEDSDAEIREEYGLDDYDGEGMFMVLNILGFSTERISSRDIYHKWRYVAISGWNFENIFFSFM